MSAFHTKTIQGILYPVSQQVSHKKKKKNNKIPLVSVINQLSLNCVKYNN